MSLQDEGKVRSTIGISNVYDVSILKTLERETGRKVQVVQNRWYEGNKWDREVCKYCIDNGVDYQCVSAALPFRLWSIYISNVVQIVLDFDRITRFIEESISPGNC